MKRLSAWLGAIVLLAGISAVAKSAGVTDLVDYCTGKNNSNCPFKIDANGNITSAGSSNSFAGTSVTGNSSTTGSSTVSGVTIFTPPTVVAISSFSTVTPTATYMQLLSTGSTIILGAGGGGTPCSTIAISTLTATNGQFLVLSSTSSTSYVQISTGTQCGVSGVTNPISLLNKAVSFIYESSAGVWKQIQQ